MALLGFLLLIMWLASERRDEQALVSELRAVDPGVRARAAFELSRQSHPSPVAIVALARLLADSVDEPRGEAVAALIALGGGDSATSRVVVDAMASLLVGSQSGRPLRVEAAHVIGQVNARSQNAVDALLVALVSHDEELRGAAASALGQAVAADARVLRSLDLALDDRSADVRAAALESLTRLRPGDVTARAAARAMSDPSPTVRMTAVYALASANRYDDTLAGALDVALSDPNADVKRAATSALERVAPSAVITRHRLQASSGDAGSRIRLAAKEALHP